MDWLFEFVSLLVVKIWLYTQYIGVWLVVVFLCVVCPAVRKLHRLNSPAIDNEPGWCSRLRRNAAKTCGVYLINIKAPKN